MLSKNNYLPASYTDQLYNIFVKCYLGTVMEIKYVSQILTLKYIFHNIF